MALNFKVNRSKLTPDSLYPYGRPYVNPFFTLFSAICCIFWVLLIISIYAGIGYVAWHFISKYW